MSDSDEDNAYSDYLSSRRVTIQKKRQPVEVYDSDSDDEITLKKIPEKRKRVEDLLAESDEESFVTKTVETHDEKLKNTMNDLEEEYRKIFYNDHDLIRVNQNDRNDALSKIMKTVQNLDDTGKKAKASELGEVEEVGKEIVAADVSTGTGSFPVSLIIMDYECRGSEIRNRRELPLESTFLEVKLELAEKWNCRVDQVNLSHNGVKIEDTMTPKDLGLRPLEVPEPIDANKLGGAPGPSSNSEPGPPIQEVITVDNAPDCITIKVQLKNRRKPVHIKTTEDTTIQDLKQKILDALIQEGEKEIPSIDKMKVMFDDEYLTDMSDTCKGIGLEDADCIDIFF